LDGLSGVSMVRVVRKILGLMAGLMLALPAVGDWRILEPGLELGEFLALPPAEEGDSIIRILRIDPRHFDFRLFNASAPDQGKLLTVREWCLANDLVAAVNASMYQKDYRTSVSLMRSGRHINNPRLTRDKAILAFDRLDTGVPDVYLIDRQCERFADWKPHYLTFIQGIRMISCQGINVWQPQPEKQSTAAIGIDQMGHVLFIHVRTPLSTHLLIDRLQKLPIRISRAMYAEGGPQAQLSIRSSGGEFEYLGSLGNGGFVVGGDAAYAWPIPNVVGIVRRQMETRSKQAKLRGSDDAGCFPG